MHVSIVVGSENCKEMTYGEITWIYYSTKKPGNAPALKEFIRIAPSIYLPYV